MQDDADSLEETLNVLRQHSAAPLVGCTDQQLFDLQHSLNVRLPSTYLRLLQSCGRNTGDFLRGSDLTIDLLPELRDSARDLLAEDAGPSLPDDAFVFFSHQGYQFLFFRLGDGADPPVFYYLEASGAFREVSPSFSHWLQQSVRDEFAESR